MSLERWQPMSELRRLHDEMDRMFENFFQPSVMPVMATSMMVPSVDVFEQDNNVMINAEVPGLKKENLDVTATEDAIVLKGEFKQEEEQKEKGFIRQERRMGKFERTIAMPRAIKPDQVKASFKDGVLTVTAPLSEEAKPSETKVNIES